MTYSEKLNQRIAKVGGGLCVGLDPRPDLIPGNIKDFLLQVIEETSPYAAAFKPNSAYFEASGWAGVKLLEEICAAIPRDIPIVLDAKRSDIGETQRYYAKMAFEVMGADAVTLNPFLGYDSIEPFLGYAGKGLYLLAVTSNPGAQDLELQLLANGQPVYTKVLEMATRASGSPAEVGFVVGLTNAAEEVLARVPDVPLLVPGLGAQGGEISALAGQNRRAPILINASRGILFAEPTRSFADKAAAFLQTIARINLNS
jgi:orotidine-5'-phosphate decarboxylase